jgi:hypothetical protein
MQEVPKRPLAAKTIRSAVIPAPEDGSKPAIVKTVFMMDFFDPGLRNSKERFSKKLENRTRRQKIEVIQVENSLFQSEFCPRPT